MLAADTLGELALFHRADKASSLRCIHHGFTDADGPATASYGSLARFDDVQRLHRVGTHTCVGAGGDMSDYQALQHTLDSVTTQQSEQDDGHLLRTSQVFEYITRVMYGRRSKMNPLWNSLVVAGWETGSIDEQGVAKDGEPCVKTHTSIRCRFG